MLETIIIILLKYKNALAIGVGLALVLMLSLTRIPEIDGGLSGFDIEHSETFKAGKKIGEVFNVNDFIEIKVVPLDTTTKVVFESLAQLEDELTNKFEGISVNSLHKAKKLFKTEIANDSSIVSTINRSAEIPIVEKLIGKKKEAFLMLILLDSTNNFEVNAFDSIIQKEYAGIKQLVSVSRFHVESQIERTLVKEVILLFVIILSLFSILIYYIFRDIKALIYIFCIVFISLIPTVCLYTLLGISLNLISSLIIPVVLILSLADAVHLLTGFYQSEIKDKTLRVKQSIRTYVTPSFFTSLTTTIAFLSFLFNDSDSMKEFGLIIALSVCCSFIFTYAISPFLLLKINPKTLAKQQLISPLLLFLSKHRKKIAFALVLLGIIASPLFTQLQFNTDFDSFIPKNSEVRKYRNELLKSFDSQLSLSILLEKKKGSTKEVEAEISKLVTELNQLPTISRIKSIKDQLDFKEKYGVLGSLIKFPNKSNPYRNAKRTAYLVELRYKDIEQIIQSTDKIKDILKPYETYFDATFFSTALLVDEVNKKIAKSLFVSLFFSFLFIFICIFFLTKNLKLTLICLFVNIIPLSFISLIFYVGNLDLDVLTAITSVVCLGIVVDDTIHVVYQKKVIKYDSQELGFSILSTSLILILGFMTFTISSFSPTQSFGVITAAIFFFTVLADLTLLPYLIDRFVKD